MSRAGLGWPADKPIHTRLPRRFFISVARRVEANMADTEKPPKPRYFFTAADLDGLTIGAAFMKFVVKDPEVQKRVLQAKSKRPDLTYGFDEGRFPDRDLSFRWPTDGVSAQYLIDLLRKPRPADGRRYRPILHEIESSAFRFANLLELFFDYLRSGEVTATGTYAASGAEIPVNKEHWERRGMFIDLGNSDLLEEVGGQMMPRWTGLRLSAAASPRTGETAVKVGKQNTKRNSSNASKIMCRDWLVAEMEASLTVRPKPKEEYLIAAQEKFADLSERSFIWAWSDAITATHSAWDRAGRPEKSLHKKFRTD
jgi:hypothetical protein